MVTLPITQRGQSCSLVYYHKGWLAPTRCYKGISRTSHHKCRFLKRVVDAVCHLNSLCKRKATYDLKDLLNDVAWHKETLPLEMMAMLDQVDYDSSDTELHKLLCRLKTGTSTTKDLLESSFAHLQSIAQRQNKNKKMNMYTKLTYAIANPHATNSAPQPLSCFQTPKIGLKLRALEGRSMRSL